MISVVMTTYNSARFLIPQLDSIRMQTLSADEVIIRDDCSRDSTCEVITSFIQEHHLNNWHFYQNESNLGYVNNFRKALSQSSGDFIFLADHDDIWNVNKIEQMMNVFETHPNILMLNSSFVQIDEEGTEQKIKLLPGHANNNLIHRSIKHDLTKMNFTDVSVYNISPGCTCGIRKCVVTTYLGIDGGSLPHDWALNVVAAVMGGLYFLNIPTISYRVYSGNAIGLGHEMNFKRREKLSQVNFSEKLSLQTLVESIPEHTLEQQVICRRITDVYRLRCEMFKNGVNLKSLFRIFRLSTGRFPIRNTILLDIFTIVRN